MLKKIVTVLALLISGVVGYAALQPAEYVIARETLIRSTPEAIFPSLNSSREVQRWMPWSTIDPQMQVTYVGPETGVGARTEWTSTGEMGVGSAEVIEVIEPRLVRTKLVYKSPMSMEQEATLTVQSGASGSTVRWEVRGKNGVIGRIVCLFLNIERQVGERFDQGLERLTTLVENGKIE